MAMEAGQLPAVDARAGAHGTRLDLDGVCRWFGVGDTVVKAVDDINLHVDEAAFVVVLGPSGVGQDHAAEPDRRAGRSHRGHDPAERAGPDHRVAGAADDDPPPHGQLRLPEL